MLRKGLADASLFRTIIMQMWYGLWAAGRAAIFWFSVKLVYTVSMETLPALLVFYVDIAGTFGFLCGYFSLVYCKSMLYADLYLFRDCVCTCVPAVPLLSYPASMVVELVSTK